MSHPFVPLLTDGNPHNFSLDVTLCRARPRNPAKLVPLRGPTSLPRLILEAHDWKDDSLLCRPLLADDDDRFGGR